MKRSSKRRGAVAGMAIVLAAALFSSPTPVASAERGHAPDAPTHLTVDDRQRHMNVAGAPRFGWLPQDRDGNEVQTAYRIRVLDRQGDDLVWDSGKVDSSKQSYVAYDGPPLERGTTYTWTVRTWDRTDRSSPWAPTATFDTGITDQDWNASWIRRTTEEADDYTLARTEVMVGDSPVVRARSYVAAGHTYELYFNGTRVDRGNSFGYPGEQYYQASDVTKHVEPGEPLAIGALYHWYGAGQGRPAVEPGLLVRIVIEHADGSREVVTTDGSWRVHRATWFQRNSPLRNGEGGRVEEQDARGRIPGWNEPGFDDSAWAEPEVVGEHPAGIFTHLVAQEPRMTETTVSPVSVQRADDGTVVADFGKVIPARPQVRFDNGVAGREIMLRTGYNLTEDGRVATSTLLTQGTNMAYPYIQQEGPQHYRAFTHLGWRYLEIPGAGEEITADDISAVVVHTDTPAGREAEFRSSDKTLDSVWDLVKRSAIYSVQKAFVDTPTREKAQFLGDAANISYATMAGFAERDHTQQALREFLNSQERFWHSGNDIGRYNAVYPNGDGKRDIPDYSEMFPHWVWHYYMESGDRQLLEEAYPAIQNTADYVTRHIPEDGPTAGLVTELSGGAGPYLHGIVDWPRPNRFGYDMETAARTTVNALAVEVLRVAGDMAEELGRPAAEVDSYREQRDELIAAMNDRLRRPDGVYIDGLYADGSQSDHAGQHSTSYAIAFGIAPEEDYAKLADYLASLGLRQGPMTAHWLLEALADAERPAAVLELLTNEDDVGWADILAKGGTFTWEAWELVPGTNFSQSHGWGSQALVDIQQTLLGVRSTSPGAATVEIAPPESGLRRASGTVPTQRGPVEAQWRRTANGVRLKLDVPVNVSARVSLPVRDGITYRTAGPTPATFVGTEDGRAVFEVGSGTSVYVPTASPS